MSDLADTVNEAVERAQEGADGGPAPRRFSLNTIVAIGAAVTATFFPAQWDPKLGIHVT